jgi:hypothetical protein
MIAIVCTPFPIILLIMVTFVSTSYIVMIAFLDMNQGSSGPVGTVEIIHPNLISTIGHNRHLH